MEAMLRALLFMFACERGLVRRARECVQRRVRHPDSVGGQTVVVAPDTGSFDLVVRALRGGDGVQRRGAAR